MAGFTIARQQAMLDAELVAGDYIAFSANGTSESANVPRIPVGAWSAATAAEPSVKANANALVGGAVVTATTVVSHYAIYSASTGGTQKIDWTPVNAGVPKSYAVGEQPTVAIGAIAITLA